MTTVKFRLQDALSVEQAQHIQQLRIDYLSQTEGKSEAKVCVFKEQDPPQWVAQKLREFADWLDSLEGGKGVDTA